MTDLNQRRILSRLFYGEFSDRESEIEAVFDLIVRASDDFDSPTLIGLLLGLPRVGKSELLRNCFDRLFNENGGAAPFFYALRRSRLASEEFARDCFSQFLSQFVAFRRNDPQLIEAADQPLSIIHRAALPEDYSSVKQVIDSFTKAAEDNKPAMMVRLALSAPALFAEHAQLNALVMMDNCELIIGTDLDSAISGTLGSGPMRSPRASYALTGLRRPLIKLIPPDQELFSRIKVINIERTKDAVVEKFTRMRAERLGVETSDSTIELMSQQLDCDFFYASAIIDAAASGGVSLKTFIEFERVYTAEVLTGRIGHYLDASLREAAVLPRDGRAALEAIALINEAGCPVPLDAVAERMGIPADQAEALLDRLHSRELIDVNYGFVSPSGDPVLSDYVRARHRSEIAGAPRPIAGQELLGEKLKHSYRLMMSRFNRGIESQLVQLLSRFDFQSVPASLFDQDEYEKRYRGVSRVQVRRGLDDEKDRVRLPQIVFVHDLGGGEQPGVNWRLFAASGFEGGIYTEANEVLWVIALINSKEPLDVESLGRIDQRLEPSIRSKVGKSGVLSHAVRWYVSKEGFSAIAAERLANAHAYRSSYSHLDLLQDYLTRLALSGATRPASEFELVIPIEDEAELIAARTAEQIARAADFDQESINQIKTALIEACINAAEHSDSPDRKIHQRFAIDEDKLIITVSNRGKIFGKANGQSAPSVRSSKNSRGRGLRIIRALMDQVEFERTDEGARLVMTKYFKRPSNQ
ncbi:MAG TPA: ATP-binding protein [Blastocatellia bacterium]|nr:ATP-binding protein [Blastocatellia bacterium]